MFETIENNVNFSKSSFAASSLGFLFLMILISSVNAVDVHDKHLVMDSPGSDISCSAFLNNPGSISDVSIEKNDRLSHGGLSEEPHNRQRLRRVEDESLNFNINYISKI